MALLAEGVAGKIDIKELAQYEMLENDERGLLRLSEIQLGRMMQHYVHNSMISRGLNVKIVHKTIGYELRAADPIPFDAEYTRNLGYSAIKYLLKGRTGAMITFYEGKMKPIQLRNIIDPVTKRTRVRFVDIKADPYRVGRKYMIRIEEDDLIPPMLNRLARAGKTSPEEFRERFSYLL